MAVQSYTICEYGLIRSLDDYPETASIGLNEIYLPKRLFDSLHDYISQNQDESKDAERPFSLFNKGKKRQIKVKKYIYFNGHLTISFAAYD